MQGAFLMQLNTYVNWAMFLSWSFLMQRKKVNANDRKRNYLETDWYFTGKTGNRRIKCWWTLFGMGWLVNVAGYRRENKNKFRKTEFFSGLYFSCDCIISSGDGNSQQSEADNSSIKAGDKVRVLVNATYDGGSFIMYYDTYDVLEVNGDRAVIGIGDTVTCAINTCNIERV